MSKIELINGSCADQEVDAVVNAANRNLWSGGGICGVIFKKAGYAELNEECKKHNTPLKDGEAVITSSCNMNNCKYIIHAVGPDFGHTPNAFKELYNAYYNSLIVLKENNLHSISFPLISSGRFGYGFAREEVDRRKNMNEKIDKMLEDIYTTLNITFPAYLNLNSYLNKPTLKAIDFEEVGKMLDKLHIETKQKNEWLIQNIKDSDSFEGKRMYSLYKEVIKSFNYLLELDIRINDRLLKKANLTKKYGFFEHRKDLKERNKESQYLASKIEELLRYKL